MPDDVSHLDAPVAHLRLDDLDLASQCPEHLKTLGLIQKWRCPEGYHMAPQ